jgi:hypothetical protein
MRLNSSKAIPALFFIRLTDENPWSGQDIELN